MGQLGFFDLNRRYESLESATEKNDPLVAIAAIVPFEFFRPKLHAAVQPHTASRRCTVPGGKNLFFPIANSEDSPPPQGTINDFRTAVPRVIDGIARLEVNLAQARKGTKYLIGGAGEWSIHLYQRH
jgi:hypothetical protein